MKHCARCGIDVPTRELCPDCLDVLGAESRRYSVAERIAYLLRERDRIDEEITKLAYQTKPTKKRPRGVTPECGTESAYQRHRALREDCPEGDACRLAHNEHNRVADIRRRLEKTRKEDAA